MSDAINDATLRALSQSMNLRLARQGLISGNIANSDTPGYKAKDLDFEEALRTATQVDGSLPMRSTDAHHKTISIDEPISASIVEDTSGEESLDANTVNRSLEMSKMIENQQLYDASVEMVRKKLGVLRYAITEGGGNR